MSGELKCSKKDAWKLADAGVNDPLLTAYVNFGHVQKYKSSFTNREYLRSDGRVRCRFGIVESGRFGRFTPRGVSNKKVNCWDTLTGHAEGNQQPSHAFDRTPAHGRFIDYPGRNGSTRAAM